MGHLPGGPCAIPDSKPHDSEFQRLPEDISNRPLIRKKLELRYLIYISAPLYKDSQTPPSNYHSLITELWELGWGSPGLKAVRVR